MDTTQIKSKLENFKDLLFSSENEIETTSLM